MAGSLPGELGRRLAKAWARRWFTSAYERPLLLLATLRYDALLSGPEHPLWPALAADEPDAAAVTAAALEQAFSRTRPRVWHSLTRRNVQTNEVSRAVAWLWPAALAAAPASWAAAVPGHGQVEGGDEEARTRGPALVLCDMGCSAGLNLIADSLRLSWNQAGPVPSGRSPAGFSNGLRGGSPQGPSRLVVADRPRVLRRLGFDRAPLDATDGDDAGWLRACIWAGERDRMARLEEALAAFRAAKSSAVPPEIERSDARDMPVRLRELAAGDDSGALWLAYQTVMREYLGPEREPYLTGMRGWLASRPPGRALWIELEDAPHGATRQAPAALVAHVRGKDGSILDLVLGRCQYHPTEIAPEMDGVTALRASLAT